MRHVYFGVLPTGSEFLHIDKAYRKIDEEHAIDMQGKNWVIEPHYGAVITISQFKKYNLANKDLRRD